VNFFTIWASFASIVALGWIIWRLAKQRDVIPLLAWFGGLIGSTNEGTIDLAGHLVWATNYPVGVAYYNSGNGVPAFAPITYAFFVGLSSYYAYTRMKKGLTVRGVFSVFIILSLVETALELPATMSGAYRYDREFLEIGGMPLWAAWVNGFAYTLGGALLYLFVPAMKTWWQKGLVPLLIPFAHASSWAVILWPVYIALNWTGPSAIPAWGQTLLTLASLGLSIFGMYGVAGVVAVNSSLRLTRGFCQPHTSQPGSSSDA
jgi:hypothetical protein